VTEPQHVRLIDAGQGLPPVAMHRDPTTKSISLSQAKRRDSLEVHFVTVNEEFAIDLAEAILADVATRNADLSITARFGDAAFPEHTITTATSYGPIEVFTRLHENGRQQLFFEQASEHVHDDMTDEERDELDYDTLVIDAAFIDAMIARLHAIKATLAAGPRS